MPTLYTPQEVADAMKVPAACIFRLIRTGKLRAAKVGRHYRIHKRQLEEYLTQFQR